jgi:hypothetical protein
MRNPYRIIGLVLLSLTAWNCDTAEPDEPAPNSPIQVITPNAGARFHAADTVKIITETDYSKVAGNLSAIYSADSGKSWDLVLSAAHKDGVARDTFPFFPKDFAFAAGQSVKLEIREYGTGGRREEIGFIHLD